MRLDDLHKLSAQEKRALLAERLRRRQQRQRQFRPSFSQQRLWFLEQLVPGSAAYNIPTAVRITGPLNIDAWRRSCHEIVQRHEALRTTFTEIEGQPTQVVSAVAEPEFSVVDCGQMRGPGLDAAITRQAQEEFQRPFDLRHGPLLRVTLLRIEPEDHVLLLTMHHIVADLWSMAVAIQEMMALYAAFSAGKDSPLPQLPIQYADYAAWQRDKLAGDALAADLAYWKQALRDAPAALELPTDRPRPAVQTSRGGSQPFALPGSLMAELRALSQREGATPFMTLLAAFYALLHRYSGQDDIVVGAPIANRTRPEIERLIGFFVNTLALRADISGDPSFRQLLARVRQACLGGYAHQELPFEKLVEELHPTRDLSRAPVFQVSFVFQNIPMPDFDVAGLRVTPLAVESTTARFDLELQVFDRADGLTGWFEYNRDLFDAATIEQLSEQMIRLVTDALADPDRPISRLAMLGEAQRRQLLTGCNDTARQRPEPQWVHLRFAEQARRTPDAEALCADDQSYSYAELDARSAQLAQLLRQRGVDRDVLVGICLERSPEMVVAMLATLRAGGAYVPLDPSFPPDRLAFMIEDSALPVLLTQRDLLAALPDRPAKLVCLDELPEPAPEPPWHDLVEVAGTDLAYVIYTSGSTGRPKGVQIPHQALANFLFSMQERPGIDSTDTLLAVTTLSFDISVLELLLPLLVGARVVLASREVATDGARLAEALAESQTTIMQATPATWRMLLDAGWAGKPGLRILCGGEALPWKLAQRLRRAGASLWNMYGPTETTVWSAVAEVDDGQILLGEPIANTELHVLDRHGQLAPPGVPGELCIGGAGLARGYLNRPELTADRFMPHPFPIGHGELLYRTGDLVRRRAGGGIEFLGRMDHQVKVRGFRIELGEIESRLTGQLAIRDAVVTVREDIPGDQRLVAYLVAGDPDPDDSGSEQLDDWQRVWDSAYQEPVGPVDPTFDIRGWNSSYTGRPIPVAEMREWVDLTVDRVRAGKPRSVLDIGCGTGLILFRLAPHCDRYWGTDFSPAALEKLRQETRARSLSQVELFECAADQLAELPEQRFDTVVLNSVVQYFPDEQYLLRVLETALSRVTPGGKLLVGDVRSLPLLECFHTSVQLFRAEAELPASRLPELIQRHLTDDQELVIDPRFFHALPTRFPAISDVRVIPKRGQTDNELTRFRYDVLLAVEQPILPKAECDWLDWDEHRLTVPSLRARLVEQAPDLLAIRAVPNARVRPFAELGAELATTRESVAELRQRLAAAAGSAADPEELWKLGEETGYQVDLDWSGHGPDGRFDLVLRRCDQSGRPLASLPAPATDPRPATPVPWRDYVNGAQQRRGRALLPKLRARLAEHLPDYMIPSAFVFLEHLPLTPNGKVDRTALPAPDNSRHHLASAYTAPRNAVEEVVAGIWVETLGLARVGVFDDFFALGGHSLLSTRIIARIRDAFQVDIPLHQIFSDPTVAGLAAALLAGHQRDVVEKTAEVLLKMSALSDEEITRSLDRPTSAGSS